ncbi:MAG: ABC transporter ATP-binding protein, partial [Chloroflexota bacterium]|nr:ABC transporter ATP-binding protein [Chloroflexota bacterium]
YGLGPFFRARYADIFECTIVVVDRLRRQLLRRVVPATALAPLAAGAIYIYVVWLIIQGERTVGDLALYGGAATMLQAQLLSLGFEIGFLPQVFHYLPSLFRILEAPPDLPLPAHPRPAPRAFRQGIVFERVAFSYSGNPTPVLHDVSFHIAPEESVALVGRNGAGKTTLVKLLLRLYDPTAGRILLDGIDLRDYDLDDLRRQMGVIFQDFVRFELTAGENIGLGQVEALSDSDRLHTAAARAGADTLLRQLPRGLDTQLGREFGGRELSGGEWQKLALARAFVRDCQLLVLDEPTAALDVQTEYEVYRHFHELTRGRMTVLISHRFSTVRMADRILYLADGRIQEAGTHTDLLAQDGEYARLYRLQAAQYVGAEAVTTEPDK